MSGEIIVPAYSQKSSSLHIRGSLCPCLSTDVIVSAAKGMSLLIQGSPRLPASTKLAFSAHQWKSSLFIQRTHLLFESTEVFHAYTKKSLSLCVQRSRHLCVPTNVTVTACPEKSTSESLLGSRWPHISAAVVTTYPGKPPYYG